jgi:hypothetical protein
LDPTRQADKPTYQRDRYSTDEDDHTLRRVSLCDMTADARAISDHIITARVLPLLELHHPQLCQELHLQGWRDGELEWATDEPAVNRYTRGGVFEPHQDGFSLTCLVLLSSAEGDFEGGGTAFFPTAVA